MRIIKTQPAPESPLYQIYRGQEIANALVRSIKHRPEIATELNKLKEIGATKKEIEISRRFYEFSDKENWPALTQALSIFILQGLGRTKEVPFEFCAAMAFHASQGTSYSNLKEIADSIALNKNKSLK